MPFNELEMGKEWVKNKTTSLAKEFGVPLSNLEWGEGEGDFESYRLSLAHTIGGKRYIEKFSIESLEDCPSDTKVQSILEEKILKFLKSKSTQTGRKIGF